MSSSMDYAFPAGDESDTSNDEWDVGCCPDKTSPRIKVRIKDLNRSKLRTP